MDQVDAAFHEFPESRLGTLSGVALQQFVIALHRHSSSDVTYTSLGNVRGWGESHKSIGRAKVEHNPKQVTVGKKSAPKHLLQGESAFVAVISRFSPSKIVRNPGSWTRFGLSFSRLNRAGFGTITSVTVVDWL